MKKLEKLDYIYNVSTKDSVKKFSESVPSIVQKLHVSYCQ